MANFKLFRISSLRKSSVLNLAERGKNLNILRAILGYEIQSVYDFCELSTRISYLGLFRNDYTPQTTFKDLPTSAWERNEVLLAFKTTVVPPYHVGKSQPTANDHTSFKAMLERANASFGAGDVHSFIFLRGTFSFLSSFSLLFSDFFSLFLLSFLLKPEQAS